jgi:nucleoside phosphorylase
VAAALKLELKPLLRLAEQVEAVPCPKGASAWAGRLAERPIIIIKTGMGREAAGRALEALEGRPLAALISMGTCGALEAGMARGDIVIAERVLAERVICEGPGVEFDCQGELVEAAAAALGQGGRVVRGALLCRDAVASEPELKRRLAARYGVVAVDMESGAVAAYAAGRGVPFLALKVVSDRASDWMLPLDGRGWLAEPVRRTLRLPRYLAGVARAAAGFRETLRGLEAAARIVQGLGGQPVMAKSE